MKKSPLILVLIIGMLALLFQACSPKETEQKEILKSETETKADFGKDSVISFLTGEVLIQHNDETQWLLADIGDVLQQGDSLQTGPDGYCELQLGGISLIRMEEDTLFTLQSIHNEEGNRDIQVVMDEGTLACKVNKLLDSDDFSVEVPSAACGIRGTEFLVKYEPGSDTVLAVQEGSVSFTPKSGEKLVTEGKDILLVVPGEEITLTQEKADEIALLFESTEDDQAREEGIISILAAEVTPLSEENKNKMEGLENELILSDESVEEKPVVELTVMVEPPEAGLKLNGAYIGKGRFKSLLSEGDQFTLESEAYSYFSVKEDYSAEPNGETGKQEVSLILEKKPVQNYRFNTNNAEISRDGSSVASDSLTTEVMLDEEHLLGFTREGFNSYYQQISFVSETSEEIEIRLKKTIESRISASTSEMVGVVVAGNKIYSSDKDGAVTSFNSNGSKLWFKPTNNFPNPKALPVVYGNKAYFAGSKTLDIFTFDSSGLTDYKNRALAKEEIQFFGSSMIILNNRIIFPTSSGFSFLDPVTGEMNSSISLEGGTRMTPTLHNNNIYIASQQGVLYKYDREGNLIDTLNTGLAGPIAIQITFYRNQGYFADKEGKICSFNPTAMTLNWTADLPGADTSVADDLVVEGSYVYAYTTGRLFRLDRNSGRNPKLLLSGLTAVPALSDGFSYGGFEDGTLKVTDLLSDKEIFTHQLEEDETITGRPALTSSQVFMGTSTGEILVLNQQDESIRLSY